MIPFCIQALQGRVPEHNERRITKPVALILLAHYVADIHQPLHVGAEYFDHQGRVVDPNEDKSALGNEGGIRLHLSWATNRHASADFITRNCTAFGTMTQ